MEVRNYPGLPQPARAAPATSSCASWGSTTQNNGFGHPPGVPSHSSAQLLAGWGGEICGWLLTWAASLPAVSLMWEPSVLKTPIPIHGITGKMFVDVPPG